MTTYHPDVWTIVKLESPEDTHHRVFAGWYGGYAGSDSWKLNSGIVAFVQHKDYIEFYGQTGSVYKCHRDTEKMSGYMQSIYSNFVAQNTDDLKISHVAFKDFIANQPDILDKSTID